MPVSPDTLQTVIDQFIGGSEKRYRHWANPGFIYSEGMQAAMNAAGGYWLLDILATECAPLMHKAFAADGTSLGILKMTVADAKAALRLELEDDAPAAWARAIDCTDFPEGEWTFYLGMDGTGDGRLFVTAFLPTEY